MSPKCPKCKGDTYQDHDDLYMHYADSNNEPMCSTCPILRCNDCGEVAFRDGESIQNALKGEGEA